MSNLHIIAQHIKFHYDQEFIESFPKDKANEAGEYLECVSRALDEPFGSKDPKKFKNDLSMHINQYTFLQFLKKMNISDVFVIRYVDEALDTKFDGIDIMLQVPSSTNITYFLHCVALKCKKRTKVFYKETKCQDLAWDQGKQQHQEAMDMQLQTWA
ncbi:hypothetical protein SCHPADRAFT_891285 [Schizopora paradoxa]|uniref:Uncharacterized protein n=1 Tax=Schizopora paradoxa TaxID=27342 RepID=A0A0H2RJL5_9AGAM|nr:hypothetical protein SCHPADRAFT_891285 [Schizopora paradoxa]